MSNWILNNIFLKIGAILAAVLLWFHVITEREAFETIDVPIKFESLSDSLIIVEISDSSSTFQLETKIKQLILLNLFGRPYMSVDLNNIKKGENRIELSKEWIILPSWRPLKVDRIVVPREIEVKTEIKDRKKVPVKTVIEGSPEEGCFVKTIEVDPDSIELIGGEKSLETIKEVSIEPVNIAGKSGNFLAMKNIIVPAGGFQTLQKEVKVNVVFEKFVTRTFSDVEIILKTEANYSVVPASIDVTVAGPENLLKDIDSSDIKAYVDFKDEKEKVIPYFNLPDGIVFKTCKPRRVEIRKIGEK